MRRGACGLAVLLALTVSRDATPAQDGGPRLVWKTSVGQPIVAVEWSSNGNCVAAATGTTVYVFDAAGTRLWDWNYRQTNRFLRVGPFQAFALSPTCDGVVLPGDPSYRYVLAAGRSGGRHLLK